ncbi:MAG: hypothetical protein IT185_12180, partial [Acidobacteria bacterium]|nr:hypothetical protein [Acidobacteriota bacterium]
MLESLSEHALRPGDLGVPEEVEYGWSGGRHILDANFTFEHNVFADAISFGLRIDTNKVPGDLKKAYTMMEEESVAAGNPSGFISKLQKKDVKDVVRRKIDEDLRSGRFRRSRLIPILWDLSSQMLYAPASGANQEKLLELFDRTFGGAASLHPLTAGSTALRRLESTGRRRDYEDLRPTRFVYGPDGEDQYPEYPWVAKGPEPKDFLGDEFLLWLWHEADVRDGVIATADAGEVAVFIDRSLDLDCAYGQTGRDALRGTAPTHMPEARDALRSGKVPRKLGLTIDASAQQFTFNFSPEPMSFGSTKLPEIEDADSPRVLFEERIALLRDFCKSMDALYDA